MSTHYENDISSPIIGPKSKILRNCENVDFPADVNFGLKKTLTYFSSLKLINNPF
jgi:hypothetical protein